MSTKKKTGGGMKAFAAGAKRTPPRVPKAPQPPAGEPARRGRPKTFDARRPLIARLSPEQYRRVRQLALDAGTTTQGLVLDGLSRLFIERGLDPL